VASESEKPAREALAATATFELKRFAWLTPDRLEVSGTFAGLQKPADGTPELVIRAGDRVLCLPAAGDSLGGPPEEGEVWQAAFEWRDAPVAFDAAQLELGADLVVDLPELDEKRGFSGKRVLEVRTAGGGGEDPHETEEPVEQPAAPHDSMERRAASVASQVELVAAQEDLREVRVAMQQIQQELERARDDLQAECERRTGDSERFREALAKLRESAEEALAVEQSANSQLGSDLREAQAALEKKDVDLRTLRGQLEAAGSALTEAEAKAEAEAEALRKRAAKLESDGGKETERLRAELEKARSVVDEARDDAERLIARLTAVSAK
jgi:hypothetical protein